MAMSMDWTTQDVVILVKNQGQYGSGWALSTTDILWNAWTLSVGSLVSLIEQQPVDYDSTC